ncbi:MAG: DUF4418 family protein [Sporomusaceae bacterium]|nr:DUF4418 family protein [Sporomusaceae bacterium]
MNKHTAVSWTALVIALAILILPRLIPVCTGQMQLANGMTAPMVCHYAFQAVFFIALLAVIAAAALFVVRTAEARSLTGFFLLLLGLGVISLPQSWFIGICPHGGACAKTAFFTTLGGALLSVSGAVLIWLHRGGDREDRSA